ncbi:MAG: SRPBCC family protein [Bacteroidota bacterium]
MIHVKYHSGLYTLTVEQELNTTLDNAWAFFSNPANLAKITPKKMGFEISSAKTESMYPGQIIAYRVGIFPFIKSSWVTEITHVNKKVYFVDEQRFGPYSMWHHEHHFLPKDDGMVVQDKVSYKIPCGILGRFAHWLFIRNQLNSIFKHRFIVLNKHFNKYNHPAT